MENKTSFDLNGAVQRWKEELAQSPAFSKQDLDELEGHLNDSLVELQRRGLSQEEPLTIATRRLGSVPTLEREYGRVNHSALWTDRLLWMVLGCAFVTIVRSIYTLPLILFVPGGLPPFLAALIWSFPVIVAGLILRSMIKAGGYVQGLMSSLLCKPGALFMALIVAGITPGALMSLTMTKYTFMRRWDIASQTFAGSSLWIVIMGLFVFVLARRRLRLARG